VGSIEWRHALPDGRELVVEPMNYVSWVVFIDEPPYPSSHGWPLAAVADEFCAAHLDGRRPDWIDAWVELVQREAAEAGFAPRPNEPDYPTFEEDLRLMRLNHGLISEEGFLGLQERASERVDDLITEFGKMGEDRWWLLELIGDAKSDKAFDLLAAQLNSEDESLASWAARGLEQLNTERARALLNEVGWYDEEA
jgi:hypothetical protein